MNGKKKGWVIVFACIQLGVLGYLLFWRLQVGLTRFFDADEFSYLHWSAQVARGELPYADFFSYFTPGFLWLFAPIVKAYWLSANVFLAARVATFGIFLGILGVLGYLWVATRGWKWTLLPVILLAFLPMPYDKFLEIRPDNLATLLALIGVIGEIRAIGGKKNWWFWSGFFYAVSLMVLVKTMPILLVGSAIIVFSKNIKAIVHFFTGLFVPWVLFFIGWAIAGQIGAVWYSLTKLVFEVSEAAIKYPMEPNLFFYPNASFYGGNGYTITSGLFANHALWILAIFVGAYRLLTSFSVTDKKQVSSEFLVSGIFFLSIFFYTNFFPLKHSQYLIPIAVFVAFFAADGISMGLNRLMRAAGGGVTMIVLLAGAFGLLSVTNEVNAPKLVHSNVMQLAQLTNLTHITPPNARIVDLEGRLLFWPEGYPICCLPFDEFLPYVSQAPPSLSRYLELYPADYIWDGDSGRLRMLTAQNLAYIREYYVPVDGWGEALWKRIDNKQ